MQSVLRTVGTQRPFEPRQCRACLRQRQVQPQQAAGEHLGDFAAVLLTEKFQ
jgi:hypothetical protein